MYVGMAVTWVEGVYPTNSGSYTNSTLVSMAVGMGNLIWEMLNPNMT